VSEPLDRRRFLGRGVLLGLGVASAAALPGLAACSSDPVRVCGLGCAGEANVLVEQLGTPLQYERIYHKTEMFPDAQEAAAWQAGRMPVSSFKTLDAAGGHVSFASVASGAADAQLDALALSLDAGLRRDIVLIYFHEPEGETGETGEASADFAAAFRHVRSRIERGLMLAVRDRIRWSMCLTYGPYADGSVNEFYPGDDMIDVVAVDGYNWCPGSGHGTHQIAFRELFTAAEAFAREHGKPWLVTEVGTWDDPASGWSKAEWIDQAAPVVEEWPSLEAVMWYERSESESECDWAIGEDGDALDAFRRLGEQMCARA
jgi:hypothetical protein